MHAISTSQTHSAKTAVVFAYHNVGVRCLKVLLASDVDVKCVITHQDNPNETIWFESVMALCKEKDIPYFTPESPNDAALIQHLQNLKPDFLFSFYYRFMLPLSILDIPRLGAYNMHGSLLPKYRGRVPVNWAVLHGETETGASLHEMTAKPDAGAIIAQAAVPILPDDTAFEVFGKVTVAAEQALWKVLPYMLAEHIPQMPNDLSQGSYFSGRKPEDGCIDWEKSTEEIYNLHRAVAPPYPGAYFFKNGHKYTLNRAILRKNRASQLPQGVSLLDNTLFAVGKAKTTDENSIRIEILEILCDGQPLPPHEFERHFASSTAQ